MNHILSLLDATGTVVTPSSGAAAAAADGAAATAPAGGLFGGNPIMIIVVYCVVIFGALYFFSIRPQKKREAESQKMRDAIKVGDSVLLTNGMFGIISDVTAECFVVEFGTNKGIRIPVLKSQIVGIKTPNLSNKEIVEVESAAGEKKGFFGKIKKDEEEKSN